MSSERDPAPLLHGDADESLRPKTRLSSGRTIDRRRGKPCANKLVEAKISVTAIDAVSAHKRYSTLCWVGARDARRGQKVLGAM
jgi:hypothetical protein